jgi:hypothetical protein
MNMKGIFLGLLIAGAAGLFAQEAIIRELSGTVEVKAPGAAAWSPARAGQTISRQTMISTGFRSTAVIVAGNSVLMVQPLTRLTLRELQEAAGNEQVNIELRTGRFRADVRPPAGGRTDFTVRSPSATASVRGTIFDFDGINLQVAEGRVHLTGGDGIGAYVGAGHGAKADTETGRIRGAAETARDELAPSLPTGVDSAPRTSPASPAAGSAAAEGSVDMDTEWL